VINIDEKNAGPQSVKSAKLLGVMKNAIIIIIIIIIITSCHLPTTLGRLLYRLIHSTFRNGKF
jgi:hypothetical protein